MNTRDIELAVHFLRKVVARGIEEDTLVELVHRMEREVQRRKKGAASEPANTEQ